MRFADKRYYIEAYVKCANCGVLIYESGINISDTSGAQHTYCSQWCRDWAQLRESEAAERVLPLPKNAG